MAMLSREVRHALHCPTTDKKPGSQRVGHLRDPNGFIVEICSPMGG